MIERVYWNFLSKDQGANYLDISKPLEQFLIQIVKEDSVICRILKVCNKSILAPAIFELTMNVSPKVSFKDGGGWKISIEISETQVTIMHQKRQVDVSRRPEFVFEWKLIMKFDRDVIELNHLEFKLSNLIFQDFVSDSRRNEVSSLLENYFNNGPVPGKKTSIILRS